MFSDELVISYFFPPSNNISGIVLSKRIIANGEKVDVLTTPQDNSLEQFSEIMDNHINSRYLIETKLAKDSPDGIFEFIENSLNQIDHEYKTVTSRSWLMSNHFLALEYKFKHPNAFWRAEFSDPLLYDVNHTINLKENHKIDDEDYFARINEKIPEDYPKLKNKSSTFFTVEYLTFLFADEIIFTNANQRDLMIEDFPIDVRDLVLGKATVSPHPTLPDEFYRLAPTSLILDDNCINLAYFGDYYYPNRHFEQIFYALESLNHKFKDKIRLYIFISNTKLLKDLVRGLSFSDNIFIKKPLDYLEFLNASTEFDVLIVNDLKTTGVWDKNPYLPSKLSDYLGSKRDIWAIAERQSTLDNADFKYRSYIDDYQSNIDIIAKILDDNGFGDEYTINDDYFKDRLTYLNQLLDKAYNKNSKSDSGNPSIVKKIFKKLR